MYNISSNICESNLGVLPETIENNINLLSADNPFMFFDLQLSEEELECLENVNINIESKTPWEVYFLGACNNVDERLYVILIQKLYKNLFNL